MLIVSVIQVMLAMLSCISSNLLFHFMQGGLLGTNQLNSFTLFQCPSITFDDFMEGTPSIPGISTNNTGCPAKLFPLLVFEFLGFLGVLKLNLGLFSTALSF